MKDYLLALRSKDDTPSPLLMTSRTSEEDVLDSFKAEILAKQAGRTWSAIMQYVCIGSSPWQTQRRNHDAYIFSFFLFVIAEKERQRQAEKARKEDERRRDERKKVESKSKKSNQLDSSVEDDSVAKQEPTTAAPAKPRQPVDKIKSKIVKEELVKKDKMKEKKAKEDLPPYVDAQAVQHMQERPKVAHAQNHQIGHNEAV